MKRIVLGLFLILTPLIVNAQTFEDLKRNDLILGFKLRSSFQDFDASGLTQPKMFGSDNPSKANQKPSKRIQGYQVKNQTRLPNVIFNNASINLIYYENQLMSVGIMPVKEAELNPNLFEEIVSWLEGIYGTEWISDDKKGLHRNIYWRNKTAEIQLSEIKSLTLNNIIIINIVDRKLSKKFKKQIDIPNQDVLIL